MLGAHYLDVVPGVNVHQSSLGLRSSGPLDPVHAKEAAALRPSVGAPSGSALLEVAR